MGGGNSVLNISKSINNNITNLTINSIQTSSTNINQSQSLIVDCGEWNSMVTNAKIQCSHDVINSINIGKMTPQEGANYCSKIFDGTCGANGVSMKGVMQVSISEDMRTNIVSKIQNGVKGSIENAAKQSTGILQFADHTTTVIDDESTNITNTLKNYIQDSYSTITSKQTIMVANAQVSLITQDTFIDDFQKKVLNSSDYSSSVNKIATAIKNSADQENGTLGGGSTIIAIVVSIILILIVIGIILWFLKKKRIEQKTDSISIS